MEGNSKEIVVDDELMVKYLGGEASPEEAEALTDWLGQKQNSARFAAIERAWYAARPSLTPRAVSADRAWEKLAGATHQLRVVPFDFAWIGKVAALVVLGAGGLWAYHQWSATPDQVLATHQNTETLLLADQSVAVLYHETVLSYPEKFTNSTREVSMERGEAFFTIAPDKDHPFIIHTRAGDVRVVGTAFNLAVAGDQLEVGVSEGKVMVISSKDTAYVTAGITARMRDQVIEVADSVDANAWAYATHRLIFSATPLEQVLRVVEKTYHQPVNVSNSQIKRCTLTGTFDNVSAEKLLTFVAESLNLSLTKNGNGFILQGEGCP